MENIYERLFNKMKDYSNCYFPITDFLNDIRDNKDKKFNKEGAYNDLEKIFDTFMEYHNEALKYKELEKEIGCPLEVRCQLYTNRIIYSKRQKWQIDSIDKEVLVCYKPHCKFTEQAKYFKINDHKKTWWLKADKSE